VGYASLALGLILFSTLFAGCDGEAREDVRAEASRVYRAVEVLRHAPHDAKRAPLEALAQTPCTDKEVCATKDLCSRAYSLHVSADDALAAVRREVSRSGDPVSPGASSTLERAQSLLEQSRTLSKNCADAQAALGRKHRLP
jgi:hypothetical protein